MALIVECHRIEPRVGVFCLSSEMWDKTLLHGLLHGWLPAGAQVAPGVAGEKWSKSKFNGGYACEEFFCGKMMTDKDAIGLAAGLRNCLEEIFRFYGGRESALKKMGRSEIRNPFEGRDGR